MELITGGFGLLEGARWYPGHGLVFSDMTRGGLYALAADATEPRVLVAHRKGIGGLVAHRAGGWVVAGRNVAHKAADPDASTTVLLDTGPDEMFFNDLTADRHGRVFVGSVAVNPTAAASVRRPGRLYRLDLDGRVTVLADDVLVSNGLGTSPDGGVLYHVDSGRKLVWAVHRPDSPAPVRTVFVDTAEYAGVPDGLAVAADGSVWLALAGGGLVVGWDAAGARIAEIPVPQSLVTTVCFGGPGLRTLYVLTGHSDDHPDPAGGCVYRMAAPVAGRAAPMAAVALEQAPAGHAIEGGTS